MTASEVDAEVWEVRRKSAPPAAPRAVPVADAIAGSGAAADRRLVVVSNRVGEVDAAKVTQGGLAVALRAALERAGGIWFGFSGTVSERPAMPSTEIFAWTVVSVVLTTIT